MVPGAALKHLFKPWDAFDIGLAVLWQAFNDVQGLGDAGSPR